MAVDDIRIGSLFSGYGGLDSAALALLGAGSRIVWHCDIKPAAVTLLAARDPGVPHLGDIHGIDNCAPPVDALTFGWPCQPHSSAGKRLGEADPRALWPEVARVIAALRPRHLFGENVARVASNGELARVTRTLAQLGYVGTYRTLRASDVGAPHRRDRLFLYAVDAAADTESGQLRQQSGWSGRASWDGAGVAGDDGAHGEAGLTLLPTPSTRNGVDQRGSRGAGYDLQTTIALLPTPKASDGYKGGPNMRGSSGDLALPMAAQAAHFGQYSTAIARWEHVTGRAAPEPTVPNTKGNPALSPRFVEWMMGLPTDWVELPELSRSQQLSLLGDGVVPQQAIAAFTELCARMHPAVAA